MYYITRLLVLGICVYCKISFPKEDWKYLDIKLIRWVIFMNVTQEILQHQ